MPGTVKCFLSITHFKDVKTESSKKKLEQKLVKLKTEN